MGVREAFLGELDQEAVTTRKVLERIPVEKFDWKPHEKSMTMGQLAKHVADMFSWFPMTLETDELDFAKGYTQPEINTTEELIEAFEKNIAAANASLEKADDEVFFQNWKLRNGEQIYYDKPKRQVLRWLVMNHIVHHRGQLSLYLRMNDIPVPGLYGPSADEQ